MPLLVSLEKRNIVLEPGGFSFPRRHALRFEWLALLAYRRKTGPAQGGWVSLEEVRRLPLWRGKSVEDAGTNVGRYLQDLDRNSVKLVEATAIWRGPYRLRLDPEEVFFDTPVEVVSKRLGKARPAGCGRKALLHFTEKYARAMSLLLEGRLSVDARTKKRRQENAWRAFSALADDGTLDVRMRLLANLAAVRVLDSLGRLGAAAKTLDECEKLTGRVRDPVVVAKFYFANAWRYHRLNDEAAVERNLAKARALAAQSPDTALAGTSADREGLRLSKRGKHEEALRFLLQGLDARLLIDNYDAVQASCFNIGNTLQRMGETHYPEAGKWLKLSVNVCKWMHLGRYEALSEIILAKISLELGKARSYLRWMKEAEKLTAQSQNAIDILWCHIIRALYFQKQSKYEEVKEQLVNARRIYVGKNDFDQASLEKYLARKFPDAWDQIESR